jgi:hypothetical protein
MSLKPKVVEEPLKHQWYTITKSTSDMLRRLNVCIVSAMYKGNEKIYQVHDKWIRERIKCSPIFRQVIINEEEATLTLVLERGANKWKELKLVQQVVSDDTWSKDVINIHAEYTPATDILDIYFEDDKWKEVKTGSQQWMFTGASLEKYCKMMADITEYRNQFYVPTAEVADVDTRS